MYLIWKKGYQVGQMHALCLLATGGGCCCGSVSLWGCVLLATRLAAKQKSVTAAYFFFGSWVVCLMLLN